MPANPLSNLPEPPMSSQIPLTSTRNLALYPTHLPHLPIGQLVHLFHLLANSKVQGALISAAPISAAYQCDLISGHKLSPSVPISATLTLPISAAYLCPSMQPIFAHQYSLSLFVSAAYYCPDDVIY